MTKGTRQTEIVFRMHGRRRVGAGRPPVGDKAGVPHARRPSIKARDPILATIKVLPEIWNLRGRRVVHEILEALFAGRLRWIRIVHFSVQRDHIHLIVEAANTDHLSRGMQGLTVRLARAINRAMNRRGTVFKERFHARVLRTPREVRHALAYVLGNARKHRMSLPRRAIDPCSSGASFDGWSGRVTRSNHPLARRAATIAVAATSWLLRTGWRRGGDLLDPDHRPGPFRPSG